MALLTRNISVFVELVTLERNVKQVFSPAFHYTVLLACLLVECGSAAVIPSRFTSDFLLQGRWFEAWSLHVVSCCIVCCARSGQQALRNRKAVNKLP